MSITLTLMQNMSDNNVLNKSLTTLSTITGTLKDKTSIINPVITVEGAIPTNCNYFYIPNFGRYYYINDISSVHNNIYEISGHVDVLKTYNSQIRGCRGIVARQQTQYNLYIDDGSLKVYSNPTFKTMKFPNGFTTQEFVLAVAGG